MMELSYKVMPDRSVKASTKHFGMKGKEFTFSDVNAFWDFADSLIRVGYTVQRIYD